MCFCVYVYIWKILCLTHTWKSSLGQSRTTFFGFSSLQKVLLNIQHYWDSTSRKPRTIVIMISQIKGSRLHPAPLLPQLTWVSQAAHSCCWHCWHKQCCRHPELPLIKEQRLLSSGGSSSLKMIPGKWIWCRNQQLSQLNSMRGRKAGQWILVCLCNGQSTSTGQSCHK